MSLPRQGLGKSQREALERLRSGSDEDAFRIIFLRYARPLNYFFAKRGCSESERQDLVQETFLAVYRDLRQLENLDLFESWMFSIAGNLWRNSIRRAQSQKRKAIQVSLEDADEPRDTADLSTAPSGLQQVIASERLELLREAMDSLPDKMRDCVRLRVQQGLKYQEIADKTGVALNTVRSQLAQARRRLKHQLAEYFTGFDLEW